MDMPRTNLGGSYSSAPLVQGNYYSPQSSGSSQSSQREKSDIEQAWDIYSTGEDLYNMYQTFAGGETFSLTDSIMGMFSGGGGSAAAGGSTAATGGSAAGSSASGGAMAGAGWWALLAAVIVGNEEEARKRGRRDDKTESRIVDMFTGAVMEQDMEYYGDKIGGIGGEIVSTLGAMGNPEGVWKTIKDLF